MEGTGGAVGIGTSLVTLLLPGGRDSPSRGPPHPQISGVENRGWGGVAGRGATRPDNSRLSIRLRSRPRWAEGWVRPQSSRVGI